MLFRANRQSHLRNRPGGSFLIGMPLLVLLLLTGCGSEGGRRDQNTFFFNINTEPNSLDPRQISQQASWWVGNLIYEGLVDLDPELNLAPGIAESWEVSEDGLTYTFHLRPDAGFCDNACFADGKGRNVMAEDVRYSFERVCAPGSGGFWIFRGKVVGADDYYAAQNDSSGNSSLDSVAGFRVIDEHTFAINLTEPFPPFLYVLTTPFSYIVPKEGIEKYGDDYFRNPVGSGPFHLAAWNAGSDIVLERNTNYYMTDESGTQLPYLDSVWISFIGDPSTEFTDFENGNLDMLTQVSPAFAEQLLTEDGENLRDGYSQFTLHKQPGMSIEYYGFTISSSTPPAKQNRFAQNVHLRRAMNYAIDRDRLVRFVMKGLAAPASYGPIPPSTPGFTGVKGYTYDPEMARRELDSAGYPNGEGLGKVTLQISSNATSASVAEFIEQDLAKLGLDVEIRQVEHSTHLAMADKGEVEIWRTSWLADYPHAENFMANFYGPYSKPVGPNRSRYRNPKVDSLYQAALAPGLSQEEWSAIYGEAERIVIDDAPWIFLYYSVVRHVTQSWITGYTADPLQLFDLTRVRKEQNAS